MIYEFLDPFDERARQQLEQAVLVFEKTGIFVEDDVFEEIEYKRAIEDLERVKQGDAWELPDYSTLAVIRANENVMNYRMNWAVSMKELRPKRQRGRG